MSFFDLVIPGSIFTGEEVSKVQRILGYPEYTQRTPNNVPYLLSLIYDVARHDQIMQLVASAEALDSTILNILSRLMVDEVGEIKLNYQRQMYGYNREGSRILRLISSLSGVPIQEDRFKGSGSSATFFVQSYP